jgi:hypothetical protein
MQRRDPEHRPEAEEGQDAPGTVTESVPAESVPAPVPVEEQAAPAADGRARRKFVAVAVIISAVVVAVTVVDYGSQPQPSVTAGAPSTTAKSTTAAPSTTTPAPTTTTDDQQPTDENTDAELPTDEQTIATVTGYYNLLPDNLEAAWGLLTAKAQAHYQGDSSFAAYQKYWDQISSVDVSQLRTSGPGNADGTITYTYKDGSGTNVYPAQFQVVQEDGRWKIAHWFFISA